MSAKRVTMTARRYEALLLVKRGLIEHGFYHDEPYWALARQESFADRVPTAALNWLHKEGYITLPWGDRVTAMLTDKGYDFMAVCK